MPRLRDQRVRLVLIVILLLLIGVATYRTGVSIWAHHQYHAALQALEQYDFAVADAHLQKYLAVYPSDADVLLQSARTARRRSDFHQAVRQLKEAEKYGAAAEPVFVERQLLHLQTGDLTYAARFKKECADNPGAEETTWVLEALIEGASLHPRTLGLAKWGVDFWFAPHRHERPHSRPDLASPHP